MHLQETSEGTKIIMFIKISLSKYLAKSLFWRFSIAISCHTVGLISILPGLLNVIVGVTLKHSFTVSFTLYIINNRKIFQKRDFLNISSCENLKSENYRIILKIRTILSICNDGSKCHHGNKHSLNFLFRRISLTYVWSL